MDVDSFLKSILIAIVADASYINPTEERYPNKAKWCFILSLNAFKYILCFTYVLCFELLDCIYL